MNCHDREDRRTFQALLFAWLLLLLVPPSFLALAAACLYAVLTL